jgi:prophage DNA circulation protein
VMAIGMWERKVKTEKWNGVAFNIQQTTLDNGKRLQVVELPYADDPYINVMGAKSKGD